MAGAAVVVAHGRQLFVGGDDKTVRIYRISAAGTEPVGQVATGEVPVAIAAQGGKLVVAEVAKRTARQCFAGVTCRPWSAVEIFDVADPASPFLDTALPPDGLEPMFGSWRGAQLVLRRPDGFTVHAPVTAP